MARFPQDQILMSALACWRERAGDEQAIPAVTHFGLIVESESPVFQGSPSALTGRRG